MPSVSETVSQGDDPPFGRITVHSWCDSPSGDSSILGLAGHFWRRWSRQPHASCVQYFDLPTDPTADRQRSALAAFGDGHIAMEKLFGSKPEIQLDRETIASGWPAREFKARNQRGLLTWASSILAHRRLFTVWVLAEENQSTMAKANDFMNSFRVTMQQ
jgi:hypothetical protein